MIIGTLVGVSLIITSLVMVLLRRPAEVAKERAKAAKASAAGGEDRDAASSSDAEADADNAPPSESPTSGSKPAFMPGLRRAGRPGPGSAAAAVPAPTAAAAAAAAAAVKAQYSPAARRPLHAPMCSDTQAAEVGRLVGYYASAIPATPAEAARHAAAAFGLVGLDAEALGRMVEGAVAAGGSGAAAGGGGDPDGAEALGRMVLDSHAARYSHAELQARRAEQQQQEHGAPSAAAAPAEVMARAGAYTRPEVLQAVARRMRMDLVIPAQHLTPAAAISPEGARRARDEAAAAEVAARRAASGGALLRLLWAANLTDPGMSWAGFCVYAGVAQRMGLVE
ncbi:hypothetical protein HYH02_001170 [Chlamydomonas schloesseri]|uniref:Uncharacterized protein n=1 Tax=Chlamydomonas schloesseri TaxID=2026947 RepID=A0A836BCV4_9CHLO|nr:hypothetical protein HYH02_001170 [Chlamydomonas schloesseri]|eukprot:KAG2454134.1 hypothetical protein HYH02_001170 [Chlamydomonas schloesseri]